MKPMSSGALGHDFWNAHDQQVIRPVAPQGDPRRALPVLIGEGMLEGVGDQLVHDKAPEPGSGN
jgi:hypothetical protein